jgi:hypothetical protein
MSLQLNSELFPDKETYFAENFINENLIFILRVVNLIDPLKTGQNYKIISWAGQSVWLTWQSVVFEQLYSVLMQTNKDTFHSINSPIHVNAMICFAKKMCFRILICFFLSLSKTWIKFNFKELKMDAVSYLLHLCPAFSHFKIAILSWIKCYSSFVYKTKKTNTDDVQCQTVFDRRTHFKSF